MRHPKNSIFIITALFSLATSYGQTADEIVANHIKAIGGTDAWAKVSSIYMEGSMQVQGAEVNVTRSVVQNKGSKQEIKVAGMTGYNITTPTAGWNFMPFNGQMKPEPMTEEDLKEAQDELDAQDELVNYKEKGSTVELVGKDDVEGTECHKLKLTFKSGKSEYLFIDPSSWLTIRQVSKQKANGQEIETTTNFSNYQKTPEGLLVPMSITLPFGELIISKVEVNKKIDEGIFKPSN